MMMPPWLISVGQKQVLIHLKVEENAFNERGEAYGNEKPIM